MAGGALVERIDKDDPRETFEISKPFNIFFEDFHGSPYTRAPVGWMGMPEMSVKGEWIVPIGK